MFGGGRADPGDVFSSDWGGSVVCVSNRCGGLEGGGGGGGDDCGGGGARIIVSSLSGGKWASGNEGSSDGENNDKKIPILEHLMRNCFLKLCVGVWHEMIRSTAVNTNKFSSKAKMFSRGLRAVLRVVIIKPIWVIYINAPFVGWSGADFLDICTQISHISSNQWRRWGEEECKTLIEERFDVHLQVLLCIAQLLIICRVVCDVLTLVRYIIYNRVVTTEKRKRLTIA